MKLRLLHFAAVFIVITVISSCGKSSKEAAKEVPRETHEAAKEPVPAPVFIVSTLGHGKVDIEKLRGNPVVLNFWASWCGPCSLEAKDIEKAYKEFKPKGVYFLGVAMDDTAKEAKAFIKKHGITYPNGLDDKDGTIARLYNVMAIPQTVIIDGSGRLFYVHTGLITADVLREWIEKAIAANVEKKT
ncbi:MAG: TlpA family protein disulfide reductase [Deltaproteobacteria bacterium]|nr:TlpA family protein disulfide reductase [Deltaproteobacteria bacterium]